MKYEDVTHKIIGCAMKVHSTLGNGFTHLVNLFFSGIRECFAFQEVIYQRALAIEMEKQGLSFQREMEMTIFYEGIDIGTRRVDFFVEENIMLELKALIKLEDVHLAQAMNYCQAYNLPIGLLINFGAKSLEFKRVYNLTHPENKEFISKNGFKDGKINAQRIEDKAILKSSNLTNPNSDK
jgi:GxxExxY protein